MVLTVWQWNARSLIANGQELKSVINESVERPDVLCIQETWLVPRLDFVIRGYASYREDRADGWGGCATFVREGLAARRLVTVEGMECVVI